MVTRVSGCKKRVTVERKGCIEMTCSRAAFWSLVCRRGCWLAALLAALVACSGCFAGLDPIDEHLVGPYRLLAIESRDNLAIVYDDEDPGVFFKIRPVVVDVGWDSRYIVAICRPQGEPGGPLSYYYLDIAKDTLPGGRNAVTGPLTLEEFEAAKVELGLPEFTLHYPDLR
jgi:hypothetical protein